MGKDMRIARVIGKVTLNRQMPELKAGSYLVVRTCNRGTLAGKNEGNPEELVAWDAYGAREGDLIGLVEGAEATRPFMPDKVPYDSVTACILEKVNFQPVMET